MCRFLTAFSWSLPETPFQAPSADTWGLYRPFGAGPPTPPSNCWRMLRNDWLMLNHFWSFFVAVFSVKKRKLIYTSQNPCFMFSFFFFLCVRRDLWAQCTEAFYDCNSLQLQWRTGRPGEHESNPLITFSLCSCSVQWEDNTTTRWVTISWVEVPSRLIKKTQIYFLDFGLFIPRNYITWMFRV